MLIRQEEGPELLETPTLLLVTQERPEGAEADQEEHSAAGPQVMLATPPCCGSQAGTQTAEAKSHSIDTHP
jgi:hypothetical protein